MKRIFILMMLMPIALVSCKNESVNAPKPTSFPTTEGAYDTKVALYNVLDITTEDVVFAGDEFIEEGHWSEMFSSQNVKNRGISYETADGLKYRIASIAHNRPKAIFIHTGYNDLVAGAEAADVYATICDIVNIAQKVSPDTKLYVTNIFKISAENEVNAKVDELNNLIASKAKSYTFVDAGSAITDENNVISGEYLDPFHMVSEEGFLYVATKIKDYVDVPTVDVETKNTIVMMGGDVMDEIDWPEVVGKNDVVDRTYNGDIITLFVARLNHFIEAQPAKVFLMVPKSEVLGMGTEALWNTYKDFVKSFNSTFRNTQLYIIGNVPNAPSSEQYADGEYNSKLQAINKLMDAAQSEDTFIFLDPAAVLADENGNLKSDLTYDGENLNAEGLLTFATMMIDGPRMIVFPSSEEMIGIN